MVPSNQLKGVDNLATTKNITMKQFNGTDYDTLYPKTQGSQITGAVPIASGGTGGTTAKAGMYNLLNGMSAIAPATNDLFPFKDVSGSTSGLVTLTNLITAMGNNGVITTSNLSTQASNLGFSKIQTGSYIGTGTYGESNPCSLTFDFVPKMLLITATIGDSDQLIGDVFIQGQTKSPGFGLVTYDHQLANISIIWNDKTISWYSYITQYDRQLNKSNITYHWVCLG